jgi:hypothetical protein
VVLRYKYILIYKYIYVPSEMMVVLPTLYHPTPKKWTIDTHCLDTIQYIEFVVQGVGSEMIKKGLKIF